MGDDTPHVYGVTASTNGLETAHKILDAEGRLYGRHHRKGEGEQKDVWWTDHTGTGLKTSEFPFYGSEHAHEWDPDEPVILVEGEKARDALDATGGFAVLGTLGTSHLPADRFFEVLRGREVIGWADGDDRGREHMSKVLEKAARYGDEVRTFTWHDAPEDIKGPDAADHPAVITGDRKALDGLLNDLLGAPRFEPEEQTGLQGRVRLGDLLLGGIEPTAQLVDGLLYEGRIHAVASAPGTGKTMLALWIAHEVVKRGGTVLYLDAENGPKLMAERLGDLGADPAVLDERFWYYGAEVDLSAESLEALRATVEIVKPKLVVFDSLADFLAVAGLEENSNSDVTSWMAKVVQPLKAAGVAALILDHVPKGSNGKGPRGASSKIAKLDVLWNLEVTLGFDRERTGQITLKTGKDREAWLPRMAQFSVGGGVFARSSGTIETPDDEDGLTPSQRTALVLLRAHPEGLTYGDWLRACEGEMSKTGFDKARKVLSNEGWLWKEGARWFAEED